MQLIIGFLLLIPYFYWAHRTQECRRQRGNFMHACEERDWKIAKGMWSQQKEDYYQELRGFISLADDPYWGHCRSRSEPEKPYKPV